ncbi:MAG TPA: DegT/DnrJ/EryC1/StrS family aminotransferase, partial [Vicingus sp.]|nr:DegT/DnrJ/EryC1/StrS family aminotransferase [Vicingus sp.]
TSELQAAMGLAVLPHINFIIAERKKVVDYYNTQLDFTRLKKLKIRAPTDWSYSYYPVIFENEEQLLAVQKVLNDNNIIPRRYFFPSLNTLPYVNKVAMPITDSIAPCVLCLPLYVGLTEFDLNRIVTLVNKQL